MPDPFHVYVDSQVASTYLKLVDPSSLSKGVPKMRYRAVTVAGISGVILASSGIRLDIPSDWDSLERAR